MLEDGVRDCCKDWVETDARRELEMAGRGDSVWEQLAEASCSHRFPRQWLDGDDTTDFECKLVAPELTAPPRREFL